jgi:hypothetical protein
MVLRHSNYNNRIISIESTFLGDTLYIGETGRTIGTRIKEHLMMKQQTVYKHLMSHKRKNQTLGNKDIERRIIYGNLVYEDERKCIKAMEIQKHRGDLMNGPLYW